MIIKPGELLNLQVKWWTTINEPAEVVHGLVDRRYAPYLSLECLDGDYIAHHIMIKAHARAYRVYEKEFKAQQQGNESSEINFVRY